MRWIRRQALGLESAPMPRDVEALERVVDAFAEGVSSVQDVRVRMVSTLVDVLELAHGALWSRNPDGAYTLTYSAGELTGLLPLRAGRTAHSGNALWAVDRAARVAAGPPSARASGA